MSTYLLYECSLGLCLFEVSGYEEIQQKSQDFQNSVTDYKKISKIITLKASSLFKTSEQALENTNSITNRILTDDLSEFLKANLPIKKKGSNKFSLAVIDPQLAQTITESLNIPVQVGDFVAELSRAVRYHIHKYLNVSQEDIVKSQLGLGHSYSRMRCMFDVNRQDKPIIQSIALIDQLDKDINSFCMRIKEWFGWHFPELSKIVPDNAMYVKIVRMIENRQNIIDNKEEIVPQMEEITNDSDLTKQIEDAAATSMGSELNEVDLINIRFFCDKVEGLIKYREEMSAYLKDKMSKLAPNVSALVGETVAARLISHAGSLSSLAKYPASTIQILGAEKALFRALKTRGKTPKYGLLYHSSFIGKAKTKNKGKISRYLANKLAMCSRIDHFAPERTGEYGSELKVQIEERLKFLDTGVKPRKNVDVMKEVYQRLQKKKEDETEEKEDTLLKKKRKKQKAADSDEENTKEEEAPKKKKKKSL